jgi:2Fe-2S ferredoxin
MPANPAPARPPVAVRIIMQDPRPLTGRSAPQVDILAARGSSLLDAALVHGIQIEHACGGVCACSTCHIYVLQGAQYLSKPSETELDCVEAAPGLHPNSRLACQCVITGPGPIVVEVPTWNRNAAKESPHTGV